MGKPPAVIFVARHGSRLDVADKQWHLTSPAPYDPPLTYSGWKQAHALGARIAAILHHRDSVPDFQLPNGALKHSSTVTEDTNGTAGYKNFSTRRRKHKVIVHTSPYLRCIQTAIGLSGGIAEAQTSLGTPSESHHHHTMHLAHPLHSGSPRIRAMDHMSSPRLSAIAEPEDESDGQPTQKSLASSQRVSKPHLRVDAFLGEWLSPGYFEDITHPPDARLLVATAKANLMHEKDNAAVKHSVTKASPSTGNFPGGWGSGKGADTVDDDSPLSHLTGLNQSLPRLNRSSSHSSAGSLAHRGSFSPPKSAGLVSDPEDDDYALPVPSYAISPLAPIPPGYVAYAMNACLDVDYQWDSMRPPHEWGDGGKFGEEWSAMHKRFRRGLQDMVSWYRSHDNTKHGALVDEDDLPEDDDNEDTDTVLILVTHSAGCNALIGALTNQPVLLDAGMASLTMAVRKPTVDGQSGSVDLASRPISKRRRSSIDLGVSQDYDIKIIASTDHLRSGSLSSSRRSSRASSPGTTGQRIRATSLASTPTPAGEVDADGLDAVGTLKRSATAATPRSNGLWSKPVDGTSSGLWSKPVDRAVESKPSHVSSPLRESTTIKKLDLDDEKNASTGGTLPPLVIKSGNSTQAGGLWGAPPPTPPSDREKGPKRRWTLHEQR